MWNLYNKQYDLTPFLDNHPGGADILVKTKGEKDITVLFETYHAFSNKDKIKQSLNKYEICVTPDKNDIYDFTQYDQLCQEVKQLFPKREHMKSTFFSCSLNTFILLLYAFCLYYGLISQHNLFIKCFYSVVAGMLHMSLGFTVMHDASHFALSTNPLVNFYVSKIWNGWSIWNHTLWFYHHVLHHHSFTGIEKKDPDLYHLQPFARKIKSDSKISPFFLSIQDNLIPFVVFVFPGQFVGQSISYLFASFKKRIFRIRLPQITFYDETDICLGITYISLLYYGRFLPTFCYIMSLNFWYSINILPDHDTYETSVENHYEGNDWCKMQICHAGNFANKSFIWTYLFGGINYQIEHHLFPNISYIHYPTIAPVVKNYCKINNIPYVHHETVYDAYLSCLKMFRYNKS